MAKFTRAWLSFSLATFNARLLPAVLALLASASLSACLPAATKEQLDFYGRREWDAFTNTDWPGRGRALTGLDGVPMNARDDAVRTLENACKGTGTSGRATVQEGINDRVVYVDCPGAKPHPRLGERLTPRS